MRYLVKTKLLNLLFQDKLDNINKFKEVLRVSAGWVVNLLSVWVMPTTHGLMLLVYKVSGL